MKNHQIYSDKIDIRVVCLSQIELATDEGKAYKINYWARLFKATTWDEIRMITKNNDVMNEAANTLYELNADRLICQQCQARRDFEFFERVRERRIAELTDENQSLRNLLTAHGIEIPQKE